MAFAARKRLIRKTIASVRVLCYILGPASLALIIAFRRYGHVFSLRFHAFHSFFLSVVWAAAWGGLRLAEHLLPWFLATVAKEMRLAMNLLFLMVWCSLIFAAFRGYRCVVVSKIERLALRFARKQPACSPPSLHAEQSAL